MINWVSGAVIWLHLQHLKLRRNRLIQDTLRERMGSMEVIIVERLPTFHLKSDELVADLFELTLIVVEPPLLEKSKDRIS